MKHSFVSRPRRLGGVQLALLCALLLGLPLAACSDDGDDDGAGGAGGHAGSGHGAGGSHDGGHGEGEEPDCKAISSACHDVDGLSEQAAECHHVGHENDAAACADAKEDCLAHCAELAQGAGGVGGHGGAHEH